MASTTSSGAASDGSTSINTTGSMAAGKSKRTFRQVLASYFYWTYPRGSMHYDIMVTLILLFIFVTPHLWDYGAKPPAAAGPLHPVEVVGAGHGVMLTLQASDVKIPAGASNEQVKTILRKSIEPVMGDAVSVERWNTATDDHGHLVWKVWAHR
jgi:hypothetical protein